MRGITTLVVFALIWTGCTDQRDLYTVSRPLLLIDSDWEPSLSKTDMQMNATAVLYAADGGAMVSKHYFSQPTSVSIPVKRGVYDVLLLNGMMYSEKDTHLDKIYFRGTDRISTFEAVVSPGESDSRLLRGPGEYVASNEMELMAAVGSRQEIVNETGYSLKYKNGRNGYTSTGNYVEAELFLVPVAVSYECRVYVRMTHPRSAYSAEGILRGFAGSVFLRSGEPSDMAASHRFTLNDLKITGKIGGEERGEVRSPVFVTFGPPLGDPDRAYTVELSFVLQDGQTFGGVYDVSGQVEPVIERIRAVRAGELSVGERITISIELDVELPELEAVGGWVDVSGWGDDKIIPFPVIW